MLRGAPALASPVEQARGDVHDPLLGLVPLPALASVRVGGQVLLKGGVMARQGGW